MVLGIRVETGRFRGESHTESLTHLILIVFSRNLLHKKNSSTFKDLHLCRFRA